MLRGVVFRPHQMSIAGACSSPRGIPVTFWPAAACVHECAPDVTRSTGRLVALPVQKATCNTYLEAYEIRDGWGPEYESVIAARKT